MNISMDNNIENIRHNININLDSISDENVVENVTPNTEEISLKPSIWTLQEILHFGYHPPKKLKKEELQIAYSRDKKYFVCFFICLILHILDTFSDILLATYLSITGTFPSLNIFNLIFGSLISLIIIVPSLISNFTNPTAVWRTKEYKTWVAWKRHLWWIFFPNYFMYNLEPYFQYYKNFINLRRYLDKSERNIHSEGLIDDGSDQELETYSEGKSIVAKLRWLQVCMQTLPELLIYTLLLYTVTFRGNGFIIFIWTTSVIGVWLSNFQYRKAFFISRGLSLNYYYLFASSTCTTIIMVFRVMLIEDIVLYVFFISPDFVWFRTEGWLKPTILISFVMGHWIFETIRWKLCAPEGFKGCLYTFYAGIYRTSVPDVSSFIGCIGSNAVMMLEASFFFTSTKLIKTTGLGWRFVNRFLLHLNHYIVVTLLLAHFCHIVLYYVYKKKIVKEKIDEHM